MPSGLTVLLAEVFDCRALRRPPVGAPHGSAPDGSRQVQAQVWVIAAMCSADLRPRLGATARSGREGPSVADGHLPTSKLCSSEGRPGLGQHWCSGSALKEGTGRGRRFLLWTACRAVGGVAGRGWPSRREGGAVSGMV